MAAIVALCAAVAAQPASATTGTATVSGQIKSAVSGEPLSGVAVCVTEPTAEKGSGDCATSGAGGVYTVAGIAPGGYLVEFSTKGVGYLPFYYLAGTSRATAQKVTLASEQELTGVDAALTPIQGAGVTGRVVRAKDETPIDGIQVCAWEELEEEEGPPGSLEEFFALHCTSTDAGGEYVITHLRGPVIVEFTSPFNSGLNFAPQIYPEASSPGGAEAVKTVAGRLITGISARLDEGGSITGTVVEAGSRAPLAGVEVCAWPLEAFYAPSCATTGAGGAYTLVALAGGSYEVEFFPTGANAPYLLPQYYNGVSSFAQATPVPVTEGHTTKEINAALQATGAISGVVSNRATGAAVGEVLVCALNGLEQPQGCTITDEDGAYTIGHLPAGKYAVGFHRTGFATQYFDDSPVFAGVSYVSVALRATTTGVDASLLPIGYVPPGPAPASQSGGASGVSAFTQGASGAGQVVLLSSQVPSTTAGPRR